MACSKETGEGVMENTPRNPAAFSLSLIHISILDFNGSGLSLMEISHRAKDFQPVVDEAVALFKELLNIPEGYSVLFLSLIHIWGITSYSGKLRYFLCIGGREKHTLFQ